MRMKYNDQFQDYNLILANFGKLIEFTDVKRNITVEISFNKIVEPYNSYMMATYCKMSRKFREIAVILKKWNKFVFKGAEKNNRINSYSMTLMLLAFMQKYKYLPMIQK